MNLTKEQAESEFNKFGAMLNWDELNILIGQLLTYVDATFQDKEQREAHKSLIKNTVKNWYNNCERELPVMVKWVSTDGTSTVGIPYFQYWDTDSGGTTNPPTTPLVFN